MNDKSPEFRIRKQRTHTQKETPSLDAVEDRKDEKKNDDIIDVSVNNLIAGEHNLRDFDNSNIEK